MSSMLSSRRSDSMVRILALITSVLPAAATSRSRYLPPPRAPRDMPLSQLTRHTPRAPSIVIASLRAVSVVVDAALVLTLPADQDAFISDIRFAAPGTPGANQHWAGAFSSLCVDL